MKHTKKVLVSLLVAIFITNLMLPNQASAVTTKYGVIVGDKDNNYKLIYNMIVLSPTGNLMIKAYSISKALGLTYSYNSTTKKLTIKNPNNGKYLVYTSGKKELLYYSSATSSGTVKTAAYKFYYSSTSKSNVVHVATLQYILGYKYYKDIDNYYSDMGYQGIVAYSINGYSTYDIPITEEVISYINAKTFTSQEELLDAVRINMVMRKTGVVFHTNRAVMEDIGSKNSILRTIQSIDDKSTSKDADYLSLLIDNVNQSWRSTRKVRTEADGSQTIIESPNDPASLTIQVQYETTLSEERIVDSKVAAILKKLNLANNSDYEKVKKIHDYIINNASYDTSYQNSTSYDLLINKSSVCEGYTLTAYRMFVDAGLESKIITGEGEGEPHAWNLVKVQGKWYNIDLTWDDPVSSSGKPILRYNYFLKNTRDFTGHIRYDEFNTVDFTSRYPIAANSYVMP